MRLPKFAAASLLLFFAALGTRAQNKTVAERLGYPADSKLLIVHADDLAVAHSVDIASFDALNKNAVTSASVMVPCAWLTEVASFAKNHADADLGLHLTLTSEWKADRWGPVESKDKVTTLLDPSGYLWPETLAAVRSLKPEEAEREIRAHASYVTATELAGEPITAKLTRAPGNDAPIGGLKVVSVSGWFAARPSGTENIYKLYAESLKSAEHLATIVEHAQDIVSRSLSGK